MRPIAVATVLLASIGCATRSPPLIPVSDCPYRPEGVAGIETHLSGALRNDVAMPGLGGAVIHVVFRGADSSRAVEGSVTLHADRTLKQLGRAVRAASSEQAGMVAWDSIPAGTYGLLVRAIGFDVFRGELTIRAGYTDTSIVEMRSNPQCMGGVVARAT